MLLLACRVDALCTGSLLCAANFADDVACLLTANVFAEEVIGVDSDEEVTEVEGNLLAVFAKAGESLTVVTILESCGKEFNEHSVAVALEASLLFAGAAERAESCLAASHGLQRVSSGANVSLTVEANG